MSCSLFFCTGSSQTYHGPAPTYPQYSHPDVMPHLLPNQMSHQFTNPAYIRSPPLPYLYPIDHGSLNQSHLTHVPGSPNFISSPSSSSSVVSPGGEMSPQADGNTLSPPVAIPPGQQAPGMWPSQQPLISLANVISLAMNFAQSFIPPNQGYHPQMPGYGPMYPGQHAGMSNADISYHQGAMMGQYMDMYQYPDAHSQFQTPVPDLQEWGQTASPPENLLSPGEPRTVTQPHLPDIKQMLSTNPNSSPESIRRPRVDSQCGITGQLRERADSSSSSTHSTPSIPSTSTSSTSTSSTSTSSTSSPASSTSHSPQNTVSA